MRRFKDPLVWLHGLIGGTIGGAVSTTLAVLGCDNAGLIGITAPPMDPSQIKIAFISGAIVNAFLYLRKSPLPELLPEQPDSPPNPPTPPTQ